MGDDWEDDWEAAAPIAPIPGPQAYTLPDGIKTCLTGTVTGYDCAACLCRVAVLSLPAFLVEQSEALFTAPNFKWTCLLGRPATCPLSATSNAEPCAPPINASPTCHTCPTPPPCTLPPAQLIAQSISWLFWHSFRNLQLQALQLRRRRNSPLARRRCKQLPVLTPPRWGARAAFAGVAFKKT